MTSPAGVELRRCGKCPSILLPEDQHELCFRCLGWHHAAGDADCQACLALSREERERRRGFMGPDSPERPAQDAVPLVQDPAPSASPRRKEWSEYDEEDDRRCYDEDAASIFSETPSGLQGDRYPLDYLPALFASAADRMEIPLPPSQPAAPVEDFTEGLASRSRRKPRPVVMCPAMTPIMHFAQREWAHPLAAKHPALGYGPYSTVQDWTWRSGVPPIEDGVRMSLLPSSSPWPGEKTLLPSDKDKLTMAVLDRCYANAAQVVALASNMAFLAGSLDKLIHGRSELALEELEEVQTTVASFLRMSQAFAIDGGRSMAAAQVGSRHLWLGLSSLKEQEKRQLLDLPVSTSSLFGPDIQAMVERLDAASKASQQLGPHLRPQCDRQRSERRRGSQRRERRFHPPSPPRRRDTPGSYQTAPARSPRRDQRRDRGSGPAHRRPGADTRGGKRGHFVYNKGRASARYIVKEHASSLIRSGDALRASAVHESSTPPAAFRSTPRLRILLPERTGDTSRRPVPLTHPRSGSADSVHVTPRAGAASKPPLGRRRGSPWSVQGSETVQSKKRKSSLDGAPSSAAAAPLSGSGESPQPFSSGPPTSYSAGRGGGGRACSVSTLRTGEARDRILSGVEEPGASFFSLVRQDAPQGIRVAVRSETAAFQRDPQDEAPRSGGGRGHPGGSSLSAAARGCGRGGFGRGGKRAVLPIFPSPQEKRGCTSNFGPARPEPLHRGKAFSHADGQAAFGVRQTRGLDDVRGSHRCILPRSYCVGTQEVSALCSGGEVLRISPPPLRLFAGPAHVLQVRGGGAGAASSSWHPSSDLHRRLAHPGLVSAGGAGSHDGPIGTHLPIGICGQLGEKRVVPHSACNVSGSAARLQGHVRLPLGREDRGAADAGENGTGQAAGAVPVHSFPIGHDGSRSPCGSSGSTPHEGTSAVVWPPQAAPGAGQEEGCGGPYVRTEGLGVLAGPGSSSPGGTDGVRSSLHRGVHGRVSDRLGRSTRSVLHRGAVGVTLGAHQSLGDGSCAEGAPALLKSAGGSPCHGAVGQHHSGGLLKQAGGDQVSHSAQESDGNSLVGGLPPVLPESPSHSRPAQRGRRRYVQGRPTPRRVEPSPMGRNGGLAPVRGSSGRPFRQCRKRTVPTLVLAQVGRRSSARGGRLGPSAVASGSPVCISASSPHASSAAQGEDGGVGDSDSGPRQSERQVVPGPGGDGGGGPLAPAGPVRHVGPSRGDSALPPGVGTQPFGLEAERGKLLRLGLPSPVVATIQGARAPSTTRAYSARWRFFEDWCSERVLDPTSCSIGGVLEFLQFLLDRGRAAATLGVFAAAITTGHVGFGHLTARNHPLVKRFLRGARRLRPPVRCSLPSWDLQVVLEGLSGPPFEPLDRSDLSCLSYKTALLLALVSAKRAGDLTALSVHPSCTSFGEDGGLLEMWPNPAFQPKIVTSSFRSRVIRVRPFFPPPHASVEDKRRNLLCPIRALRCYLDRTATFRRSDQLFVGLGAGRRGAPLSTQRLAHWVCHAIRMAYEARGLPAPGVVRAHSTRGVAASTALFRGVSIEDVCLAASWSSSSTFARSYLMDVASGSVAHSVLSGGRV